MLNRVLLELLSLSGEADRERGARPGRGDFERVRTADELAPGQRLVFAATGVTGGDLLRGVTCFGSGARTHSLVRGLISPRRERFVDTIHVHDVPSIEFCP